MSKMIECKSCSKEIASNAKSCPSCGAKNKKPVYKKAWFWIVAVIIVAGIAGGGEDTPTETTETANTQSKQEEVVKDTFAVGEEVKLNDNILRVNDVKKSNGTEWDTPKSGYEYVIVDVTIKNGGTESITYNPFDFKVQNSKGQITDMTFTTINNDTALQSGELVGGGEVSGTVAFEQPAGDENLVLKYSANMFSDKEIKVELK